jgi:hypothetical protein
MQPTFSSLNDTTNNMKEQDKLELKQRKEEEKKEAKAKKEAAKAEQKRLKAEKHKSASGSATETHEPLETVATSETAVIEPDHHPIAIVETTRLQSNDTEGSHASPIRIKKEQSAGQSFGSDGSSPTKVKNWFKSHFSRGSRSENKSDDDRSKGKGRQGFIGGASLTQMPDHNDSSTNVSVDNHSASVRAVAMAGRPQTAGPLARTQSALSNASYHSASQELIADDVSSLSSSSADERFRDEPRKSVDVELSPPRPIADPASGRKSVSPGRDSRFREIM